MDTHSLDSRETKEGLSFLVRVKPRAAKSRVLGVKEGHLEISLAAAPVDGKANDALRRLLAETFDVPLRAVRIVRGEHAQKKQVLIEGLSQAAFALRLAS